MSKIAIITRTKDRPVLLPRVLESLKKQTYKDFVWVLVNDAGEKESVNRVAEAAIDYGLNVHVLHRDFSTGMEAASNFGIRNSCSEYIVIHDDDDTWEESFLEITVKYLEECSDALGVVTWTNKVVERIENENVKILEKQPYNHWMLNIYLSDMAVENRFPPISFLFKRDIYNKVEGFDESLPVLGDWDFNLKILLLGDIHVIPKPLANYHFRDTKEKNDIYGNTVTSGVEKHILYDSVYRNRKLREDLNAGKNGLGTLLALGQSFKRVNHMVTRANKYMSRKKAFDFIKTRIKR